MAVGAGGGVVAYDKIIPVRARLDHCADYVLNPEKTSLPDGGPRLATAINCQLDTAYQDMMDTKRRWGKSGGVQGYHIIHSYTPGEVTPIEAHEMGVELAQRLLGDKYEVIVSTHLDHDHLHCHILFNSVGFMDGAKFRNTFQDYYRDIRGISNEVSRAHGVSVIEPEAKGEHYAEWSAGQSGKATVRGLIRQDMDAAINSAFTYQTFWEQLAKMGYTIKRGPNVKYTAVRPPGGARFIRLASLGDGYTEDAIKERLAGVRSGISTAHLPPPKPPRRYTVKRGTLARRPRQKLKGFRALYVHYLYLLGIRRPSPKRPPLPFSVRKEVTRLNRYAAQFRFLQANRIDTAAQLTMLGDALQAEIDALTDQRKDLYRLKRQGQDVGGEIQSINEILRPLRQRLRTCGQIEQAIPRIQEQERLCRDARRKEQEHHKTTVKTRQARSQKFSPPDR
ncbi:relaxase/mobilization nuclease domain-containing protein [uncultured Agathobaculum sp.]|uniref:relaxase/mobilization nuclease domain-containing protein n=1 Tax=uncultured Agathobaculum sp. TaxID=2048140 RepID=UPI00320A4E52